MFYSQEDIKNQKLKLRHFLISLKILAHFDFDGSNTSQKSWNWGNKGLENDLLLIKNKWRSIYDQLG